MMICASIEGDYDGSAAQGYHIYPAIPGALGIKYLNPFKNK